MKLIPSQSVIRERFDYDPNTGQLYWRERPKGPIRPRWIAGSRGRCGYINIKIDNQPYLAHRLAWVWVHGDIPIGSFIDHIDGDKANNAIANLRLATRHQNQMNRRKNTNVSLKGVKYVRSRGKFQSQISVEGKQVYLGLFVTKEEAHAAYCEAAKKYYREFARFE